MELQGWSNKNMQQSPFNRQRFFKPGLLFLIVAAIGILIRVYPYLANRSLWLDEAMLNNGILHMSWSQIFGQLEAGQQAPIGFLMLQKCITSFCGSSEYWLRLVPLISGIAILIIMTLFMRKRFPVRPALLTILFLCITPMLVYYSSEAKQYGWETAIGLAIVVAGYTLAHRINQSIGWAIGFALVGALLLWTSHTAVFCLCGTGGLLLWDWLHERDRKKVSVILVFIFTCWILSMSLQYILVLHRSVVDSNLKDFWGGCFLRFPPHSANEARGYCECFLNALSDPAGFSSKGLAALLFLTGVLALWVKKEVRLLLVALVPICSCFICTFGIYPFKDRLILFLTPLFILIISCGVEFITAHLPCARNTFFGAVLVSLILFPALETRNYVKHPWREEIKEGIRFIAGHRAPDDKIVVYYGASSAFEYYRGRFGINSNLCSRSFSPHWDSLDYVKQPVILPPGNRIWVLYTHIAGDEMGELNRFIESKAYKQELFFEGNHCWVYSYNKML
jgi:uncharacterized membrane protein